MQLSSIVLTAALAAFGTQNMAAAPGDPGLLRDCVVTFIYDTNIPADLPAQQGGVIRSLNVKEGDQVKVDAILAQVDDATERTAEEAAVARLDMAKVEFSNDVNVRYAKMAADVYYLRLKQAKDACDKVPDAYTFTELKVLELQYKQYMLQTEQAEHEQNLAGMTVRVREAEKKQASYELARRVVKSPVEGVVVEVFPRVGAWLRAGDPIARVVQLDRLRIEGYLQYGPISPADVDGKPVTVQVQLAKGQLGTFQGRIDSVDPIIEGGSRFRVRAEVINQKIGEHWALMGGMTANMQIHWQN